MFALRQVARLLLMVAVLFGSIGTRGTVLCWSERGVAVESSCGGRCSSGDTLEPGEASLAEPDPGGSCVDVVMPRTEMDRFTRPAAEGGSSPAATVAARPSQEPDQREVPLRGAWQRHSFVPQPAQSVVLLI